MHTIAQALRTFPACRTAWRKSAASGRTLFINDSKATNADSTEKALASFDRDIFWIVGRPRQGRRHRRRWPRYFARIAKAYLIGEAAEHFAATLDGKVPLSAAARWICCCRRRRRCRASAAREPVVLLSPACASYDQFKGFDARGDAFRQLVAAIPGIAMKGGAPA